VLYGLRVPRCGHGGRAVPPLHDDGSVFVEVNVVRPATFICDALSGGRSTLSSPERRPDGSYRRIGGV
jgi:hypothetical protein